MIFFFLITILQQLPFSQSQTLDLPDPEAHEWGERWAKAGNLKHISFKTLSSFLPFTHSLVILPSLNWWRHLSSMLEVYKWPLTWLTLPATLHSYYPCPNQTLVMFHMNYYNSICNWSHVFIFICLFILICFIFISFTTMQFHLQNRKAVIGSVNK